MKKKILSVLIIIVCLLGVYAAYLYQSNKKNVSPNSASTTSDNIKSETGSKADNQISEDNEDEAGYTHH